ncbi:MAG TPA: protein phosphatase 2C domain-containing protein [Gemmataceae bacterium]|nr:protein phosphatase 2C domain-containing protein [Gemmataceae bacterium]
MKPNDEPSTTEQEVLPTWDVTPPPVPLTPVEEAVPDAQPVPPGETDAAAPVVEPVGQAFQSDGQPESQAGKPDLLESALPASPEEPKAAGGTGVSPVHEAGGTGVSPVETPILCPVCGTARKGEELSCGDCGYYFSTADLAPRSTALCASGSCPVPMSDMPSHRLKDRFEIREQTSERCGVTRYRGLDHGDGSGKAVPVVIVRQAVARPAAPPVAEEVPAAEPVPVAEENEEVLPDFDETLPTALPATEVLPAQPTWPSIDWEQAVLATLEHPGLPAVVDRFTEGDFEYLVEEVPEGRSLWDAWDDPEADAELRFGYLAEVAEILRQLHHCNVILEGLRPELIVIALDGRARLTDLGELLPLPLPPDLPLRRMSYTAPEVLAGKADARADLYSFGAMLYALHVGRDLNEVDFDRFGIPKPFIPRFPDIHPAFGRLMTKTFRKDVEGRFPSDEALREDATGFVELIRTLRTLGRTLDNVRLEIAAWTTTGMTRTGNEDAFALLHACESRQDDLGESAVALLCDGMGGYEAGEIAAALAIQIMREYLVKQKPFAPLCGASSFADILDQPAAPARGDQGHAAPPINIEEVKKLLRSALKEANKQIYVLSRMPGSKRRGMGCTAEAVYVDGRNVIVGHVGDSRTYHLHEGRLIQLTRDQTLVNRLVELGMLSPEEAETHPRRNELQQAIGGQPDVEPGLYHGALKPGDWVVVCSDGLTNQVSNADLEQMLRGEGYSAETVARRLVNLANLQGATDNVTVVVIRAT